MNRKENEEEEVVFKREIKEIIPDDTEVLLTKEDIKDIEDEEDIEFEKNKYEDELMDVLIDVKESMVMYAMENALPLCEFLSVEKLLDFLDS